MNNGARAFNFSIWGLFVALASHAHAADALPYSTRTQGYTGFSTTVTGDLRSIGVAGSSAAISDSITSGSQENPAALSMTMDGAGLQIISVETSDGQVQNFRESVSRGSFG